MAVVKVIVSILKGWGLGKWGLWGIEAGYAPRSNRQAQGAGLVGYSWYNEYVELTKRYRWQVAAYIAWSASPAMGRLPRTQQELAAVLGYKTDRTMLGQCSISSRTVSRSSSGSIGYALANEPATGTLVSIPRCRFIPFSQIG